MPLTPADVRNKQFSTTRLRPGYDEEEVDAFLDEVEAELDRLIQENEELRAKLAESLRGKGFVFYDWGDNAGRLVVSWDQPESEVAALAGAIAAL